MDESVCLVIIVIVVHFQFSCFHAEAVPKKILDLMNVEKLTRENVASHLQAYTYTPPQLNINNSLLLVANYIVL